MKRDLKDIKKTAGLLHNPSQLLSIDSLVYYEKARQRNLLDFEGQNNELKKELDLIKGKANKFWKEKHDKIKNEEKTKDMRPEDIKLVCDKLMKTKIENDIGTLNVKYPFLKI